MLHVPSYELGLIEGAERERERWERDTWQAAAETARVASATPPFDVLAERRGQHERAERQRSILRERGVVAS